jgi:two-component system phosphate regulon sensor histidine kinase PhoR
MRQVRREPPPALVPEGAAAEGPRPTAVRRLEVSSLARAVRWPSVVTLATGLVLATSALVWLGYVATRGWTTDATALTNRRAQEAMTLVRAAIVADMKGAWISALVPIDPHVFDEAPPASLLQVAAKAFARFPYPESFVLWTARDDRTWALNRAERPPAWDQEAPSDDPFPVVVRPDPPALTGLVSALRAQASPQFPFAVVELPVGGSPYQVVAHVVFNPREPHDVVGFVAFTVSLAALGEYFAPLLAQVETIGGFHDGVATAVTDEQGHAIARTGASPETATTATARFPLLFLDASLARAHAPPVREWTVSTRPIPDAALLATLRGARQTFVLIVLAAGASVVALLWTVRANRAAASLATMKSDFVAAVTHELKTPVALIRLVGDTLANGRYRSDETVKDYARLLAREASRLSHTIDGLLTYARYADARTSIERDWAEPGELVDDALQRFRPTIEQSEFALTLDVAAGLPSVCVDRAAIVQALENIVDNAIKYSGTSRTLALRAADVGGRVVFSCRDTGCGIEPDDLGRVFERFYRGRNATTSGSGLGLALTQRIVERHGGRVSVCSAIGEGTQVTIELPAGSADRGDASGEAAA